MIRSGTTRRWSQPCDEWRAGAAVDSPLAPHRCRRTDGPGLSHPFALPTAFVSEPTRTVVAAADSSAAWRLLDRLRTDAGAQSAQSSTASWCCRSRTSRLLGAGARSAGRFATEPLQTLVRPPNWIEVGPSAHARHGQAPKRVLVYGGPSALRVTHASHRLPVARCLRVAGRGDAPSDCGRTGPAVDARAPELCR